jgi:hypothetical protein
MNLGSESGDQAYSFEEKKLVEINLMPVFLSVERILRYLGNPPKCRLYGNTP